MKTILGISAYYHDSAAAIIHGGEILAAAQEERFTREKHTAEFPLQSIKYCLEEAGVDINELDAIVFYDKPLLKFERLMHSYYAYAPRGFASFAKAMPIWLDEKLFLKKKLIQGLSQIDGFGKKKSKLLFPEHHLSHAASAYFVSNFEYSAILTIDGVGEWATSTIALGSANKIEIKRELRFPHSVGLLYSSFTYYLGFQVNSGEYKLMGLAPYGDESDVQVAEMVSMIKKELVHIYDDGSIWLNNKYFNYTVGLRMINEERWEQLFGFATRRQEDKIGQHHCNLALAIQRVTEEIVLLMAKEAKKLTNSENLCLAGGVALNCVANGKLLKSGLFKNIFVQPAAGDAGGALGAALAANYLYFEQERLLINSGDLMKGSYLGPMFCTKEVEAMNKKVKAVSTNISNDSSLFNQVAELLASGKVVGWFQGRMEFGPRALGNRSILADSRALEMQQKLNVKIKFRESFRPFAPAILQEDCAEIFDISVSSPYMLMVAPVKRHLRLAMPEAYNMLNFMEKLACPRSPYPAITHLDYSARIQTVTQQSNSRFYSLLKAFKKITSVGILANTSFNVRGEPIVNTPYDAYKCFMATDMDVLVINNFIYLKENQKDYQNKEKWQSKFKSD